jgi:ribosome-associated toxin RatA of RatAB toxin-antitoxin module
MTDVFEPREATAMPLVEVTERVDAPIARVWEVVNDIESYPEMMEPVISIEVLDDGPDYRVARWEIELKGCVMGWVERESVSSEQYRIDFQQAKGEGDLEEFDGYWQLSQLSESSTSVTLSVHFEIGMPMLSEMLDPVAEQAIRDNSRSMLTALASHAAQGVR